MKKELIKAGVAVAVIVTCIVVFTVHGCKKESSAPMPGPNQVIMKNTAYYPTSLTVALNTTVTWMNEDNMAHTVTSDSGVFSSSDINPGQSFTYQFTKAGNYPYHCTIHPWMTATVTVQAVAH